MSATALHWWLNFASMAGIAVLAVPVWSLNRRKKRRHGLRTAKVPAPGTLRARLRPRLEAIGDRAVADWRRIDEWCLWGGYALLLGAAVARLFVQG